MSFKERKISSTAIEPAELVGEVSDLKAIATRCKYDLKPQISSAQFFGL